MSLEITVGKGLLLDIQIFCDKCGWELEGSYSLQNKRHEIEACEKCLDEASRPPRATRTE